MEKNGDFQSLVNRVKEKANARAAEILERTRKAAERDINRTSEECSRKKQEAETRQQEKIDSEKKAAVSEIEIRERRSIMNRQETVVNEILNQTVASLAEISDREDRKALLRRLTAEGIRMIGKEEVNVFFNRAELQIMDGITELEDTKVHLKENNHKISGGPVVSDLSGRVIFDNTFESIVERKRTALRRRIAGILDF